MFRIAICDDMEDQLRSVHASVDRFFLGKGIFSVEVKDYNSPELFLRDLDGNGGWDIVLLDICMPGMLGIDVARIIRERSSRTEIIFLSVSKDFAIDAFSINAVHYLLKPYSTEEFDEAMNRALEPFSAKGETKMMIQMENGAIRSIDIADIIFIESVGYRRVVHAKDGIYEETKNPLSKMLAELEILSPGQFIVPYRGYIVNLDEVRTITNNRIEMQDGTGILIKRGDFRRLRDTLFRWAFRNR